MQLILFQNVIIMLLLCYYYVIITLLCWSALAPTPAQLQLGAKEAINSMEMPLFFCLQP
jgi:hypothetical protein